jgi:hypothetical protein
VIYVPARGPRCRYLHRRACASSNGIEKLRLMLSATISGQVDNFVATSLKEKFVRHHFEDVGLRSSNRLSSLVGASITTKQMFHLKPMRTFSQLCQPVQVSGRLRVEELRRCLANMDLQRRPSVMSNDKQKKNAACDRNNNRSLALSLRIPQRCLNKTEQYRFWWHCARKQVKALLRSQVPVFLLGKTDIR